MCTVTQWVALVITIVALWSTDTSATINPHPASAGPFHLLKRAISYESATPIPCVLGCSASLDLINDCADTASPASRECQSTCSQRNYNRTVQCLECTISNGGTATVAELQEILDNLNQLCGNINIGLTLQASITGGPTTTGPFSTSTEGNTLTLEIWTGLTPYITAGGGSVGGSTTRTGVTDEVDLPSNTGRPIPSVISTPSDSTARVSRSTSSVPSTPSASAPAATTSAPNAAWPSHAVPSLVAILLPLILVLA